MAPKTILNTNHHSLTLLQTLLDEPEGERLEFKEAKTQYDWEKLTRYCVALANEGGGRIIFGVSDKRPRKVVGSRAFPNLSKLKSDLGQRVRLRIEAESVEHSDGRVVIITIPSRPIGMPLEHKGAYLMRRGEELVAMGPEVLRRIFDEAQPDYSGEFCNDASMADLHPDAIARFRELWAESSENPRLLNLSDEQLLEDAGLVSDGQVTYAALILLGNEQSPCA